MKTLFPVAFAPTNPMFVVGRDFTSIRASWTPPSPLGGTTGYRIYYTRAGGSSDSVDVDGGNTNSHTLMGLSKGETYTISIVGTSTHFSSDTVPLPGRSGTFIAIDVMLQKLEKRESLDIMNWVCRMRAQRASMVQTSVCLSLSLTHSLKAVAMHYQLQYMFIYKTVAHAFAMSIDGAASRANGDSGEGGEISEDSKADSHTALSQLFQVNLSNIPCLSVSTAPCSQFS